MIDCGIYKDIWKLENKSNIRLINIEVFNFFPFAFRSF